MRPLSHELKFQVPLESTPAVAALLGHLTRPDPEFPEAEVCTLYFDGPGLDSLREKIDSDYLKTKVRLRWYEVEGAAQGERSFLEVKRRVGGQRNKARYPTELPPAQLAGLALDDPRLEALPRWLQERGEPAPLGLAPTLLIRYRRQRFVEPLSGARIALDREIRPCRSHPRRLPGGPGHRLAASVVEVKGGSAELPLRLRPLLRLGGRRVSFSKYAACAHQWSAPGQIV